MATLLTVAMLAWLDTDDTFISRTTDASIIEHLSTLWLPFGVCYAGGSCLVAIWCPRSIHPSIHFHLRAPVAMDCRCCCCENMTRAFSWCHAVPLLLLLLFAVWCFYRLNTIFDLLLLPCDSDDDDDVA